MLYSEVTKQTFTTFARKKVSPANALHHSTFIYNQFNNRILYPFRTKKEPSVFTAFLLATHSNFNLMTAKNQKHYVFRHEGRLNGIENDVVLLRHPKKYLENQKRCRLFSTHYLFINEWYSILLCIPIVNRSIFRQIKTKLALDSYQIRSTQESEGTGYGCHWHILCAWPERKC